MNHRSEDFDVLLSLLTSVKNDINTNDISRHTSISNIRQLSVMLENLADYLESTKENENSDLDTDDENGF